MVRKFRAVLLTGVMAAFSLGAGSAFAADKCTIATKGDSPVAKACADGGIAKAKTVMKEMSKDAKKAGMKTECDDCHKNDTNYELTKDGKEKFQKMLAAVAKK
jgi:hypothetical protein